ncbi:MAG TPA: hypothetical protein VFA70_10850 [Dehalococcoidia bacterium]|nr:hypothetical protein [Dehalococcoidia bacterium]
MIAIIVVGVVCLLCAALGVLYYRRTLGAGPFQGTVGSAVSAGLVLGLFLGLSVGLLTLFLVLLARYVR